MKKSALTILCSLSLVSGCATSDEYVRYLDANTQIAVARSNAEAERFKAIAAIAASGDATAKVAGVMALQEKGASAGNGITLQAPKSLLENIAPFFSPLLHFGGIIYQAKAQMRASDNAMQLGMRQSDNATALGISTNGTFASLGQSQTSTASAGFATVNSLGQSGFNALGTAGVASSVSAMNIASQIQAPQPNVTISGGSTGVLGGGSALSGTGVLGSGSYSTPTSTTTTTSTTNTNDNHMVTTDNHQTVK